MIDSSEVKQLALDLGADLCGIAPVNRFDKAPKGFHPRDVYTDTHSVVVIAKRFPEGPLHAASPIPYSSVNDTLLEIVTRLVCQLCVRIEGRGDVMAIPAPSEPYEYWDEEKREGRGILSLKHAAWLAGLGTIGRNTLLTHPVLGNRITLGAILVNVDLEDDPVIDGSLCIEGCHLCMNACPVGAIQDASAEATPAGRPSGAMP